MPVSVSNGTKWSIGKNRERHRVTPEEAENVFFNAPIILRSEAGNGESEKRYRAMG